MAELTVDVIAAVDQISNANVAKQMYRFDALTTFGAIYRAIGLN